MALDSIDEEWTLLPEQHHRTIIHIDIDCFYAQVEMVQNPDLQRKPVGIKQKNIMITCNYVARSLGVKKSMFVSEAQKILPSLVLIDGSDLTHYRRFSTEISGIAQTFSSLVERMGLDENFLDVTEKIDSYLDTGNADIEGHIFGDKEIRQFPMDDPCGCGCYERLVIGSHIARDLRKKIYEQTGITCCAGTAHNKIIAKLVSGYHKPNEQTVIFPWQVRDLINSLKCVKSIPGIGSVMKKYLNELEVFSVSDLQNVSLKTLSTKFDNETCRRLKNWSFGVDEAPVQGSVKPQSIGLEDAFKKVTSFEEVKVKYKVLLERLLSLLAEDGREPASLKVSVRKFDLTKRYGHRETKQMPLSSSFFSKGVTNVSESAQSSMFDTITNAFRKLVDVSKPFHLTLIGLGFSKFVNRQSDSRSICHFFQKRSHDQMEEKLLKEQDNKVNKNVEYSVNIFNRKAKRTLTEPLVPVARQQHKEMLLDDSGSDADDLSGPVCSDSPVLSSNSDIGREKEDEKILERNSVLSGCLSQPLSSTPVCDSLKNSSPDILEGIDSDVFKALPKEIQEEVLQSFRGKSSVLGITAAPLKTKLNRSSGKKNKLQRYSSVENYFLPLGKPDSTKTEVSHIKNKKGIESFLPIKSEPSCSHSANVIGSDVRVDRFPYPSKTEKMGDATSELPCSDDLPEGVDPDVFKALPDYLQREILEEKKSEKQIRNRLPSVKLSPKRKKVQPSPISKYLKKF